MRPFARLFRVLALTAPARGAGGRWRSLAALALLTALAVGPGARGATGREYDVYGDKNQTNGGYHLNSGDTLNVGVIQPGGIYNADPAIRVDSGDSINVAVYGPGAGSPYNSGLKSEHGPIIQVIGNCNNTSVTLRALNGTTALVGTTSLASGTMAVIDDRANNTSYVIDNTTISSTTDSAIRAKVDDGLGWGMRLDVTNGSQLTTTAADKNTIDIGEEYNYVKIQIRNRSQIQSAQSGIYVNGYNAQIVFDQATASVGANVIALTDRADKTTVTVKRSKLDADATIVSCAADQSSLTFTTSKLTTKNGNGIELTGKQNSLTLRGAVLNAGTEGSDISAVWINNEKNVCRVLDGATVKSDRAGGSGILNHGADVTIVVAGRGSDYDGATRDTMVQGKDFGVCTNGVNTMTAVGKQGAVKATGANGAAIALEAANGSVNVSGTVQGVKNSLLVANSATNAVVNLMDGAVIEGSTDGLSTAGKSYLTFGYAPGTDANAGDWWAAAGTGSGAGNLQRVDNDAVVTVKDRIVNSGGQGWFAYFAAGTADIRADATVREAHVGAAGFAEAQLIGAGHTATTIVPVAGAEALVKVAAGKTFKAIDSLQINSGGTVEVNGKLELGDPAALRLMGGTLRGFGAVTSDVVASGNGGAIGAGSADRTGTLTFDGNLTVGAGVALAPRVTADGSDLIKVNGAGGLTLDANSQVKVTVATGAGLRPGERRVVAVAANGIADNGAVKTVSDAVLVSFALDVGATEIAITTHAKIKAIQNALASVGDEADAPLAATLDSMVHHPPQALDGVYAALYRLGTAEAVARAVRELNAVGVAAAGSGMRAARQDGAAIGQFFGDSFAHGFALAAHSPRRPGGRREDANAAPDRAQAGGAPTMDAACLSDVPAPRWEGFLTAIGGFGSQGSRVDVAGYDQRSIGLLAGMERRFDRFALGGQLSWARHHADVALGLGEMDDNVLRFGPYARYQTDNFYALTAPGVGLHLLESKRNIDFMGLTARGERTGMDASWLNQVGFAFALPGGFCASPSAALAFSYMHDPDFAETGAGAVGLRTAAADYFSLGSTLAFRLGRPIALGGATILPEVWAGWEHEYLESGNIHCEFIGAPGASWQVPVDDIAADRAVLGAGLSTLMGDRWEAAARYEGRLWEGGCNHAFAVTLSVKF